MNTATFTTQLRAALNHAITAHQEHPNDSDAAIRKWDGVTPYVVHPIWSAMTLLTETVLPPEIRYPGYLALLWHDILEDTKLPLPVDAPANVASLVEEMTFESFEEETRLIWERSDSAKLLKLYDKVSNLLDNTWRKPKNWNDHVSHTVKLARCVVEVYGRYGDLNIVKFAQVVCRYRALPSAGAED